MHAGTRPARQDMLVEAAWSATTAPGPLRAFFHRVQRNSAPAAAVATARKLAVMIWHVLTDGTEYAYARPAFTAMKLRKAALVPALHASMARRDQVGTID